jgi:cysteine desulfurase
MSARSIYADYAAAAPLRPCAEAALTAALRDAGNPSSAHRAGARARARLESARETVGAVLGAHPLDVVFTSGATEANNLALAGVLGARGTRARLAVAATEHSSVLEPARVLAAVHEVVVLPVGSDGRLDPASVTAAAPDLLSVALVNAETGIIQDLPALAAAAHQRGALVHVDAAQGATTMALDVGALGADLLTLSAHKLGGPPGAGALYVGRARTIARVLHGGPQERGLRPGSENVPAIAGFAAALAEAAATRDVERRRVALLTAALRAGIERRWPTARFAAPDGGPVAPHIVNVSFPGLEGESLVAALDLDGVCTSAGSACAAGAAEPSHVLLAMGRSPAEARSTLRLSLGWESTEADVAGVLTRLATVLARVHDRTREAAWPALAS